MLRIFIVFLISLVLGMGTGCIFENNGSSSKELILYSVLEPEFTQELLDTYNKKYQKNKNFIPVKAIYKLEESKDKPDMVLGPSLLLATLKQEGKLQTSSCNAGELIPFDFKDVEGYWTGIFYDPLVFVINQQFARKVGQKNLLGWNDIENLNDARFTMENLNNSLGTMNLLGALAGHMGEQSAITYMWNANRNVVQYTKFPFSSIRLVATGEADMTVTVQSMVSKYLENEFPAYVVYPIEGSPANLYGIAAFRDSENTYGNQAFMEWLIKDDQVKVISQKQDTGFIYLVQEGKLNPIADPRKVWINRDYLTREKLEALTNQWVEKVRFSNYS